MSEAQSSSIPELKVNLPPDSTLLFVTSCTALDQLAWGESELSAALAPHQLIVLNEQEQQNPSMYSRAVLASQQVRREIVHPKRCVGVVLLGGYDSVPSRCVDCLDNLLRSQIADSLKRTDSPTGCSPTRPDEDEFIVWNDDHYADLNGDGFASLPVSRIPTWWQGRVVSHVDPRCQAAVKRLLEDKFTPLPTIVQRQGVRDRYFSVSDRIFANALTVNGPPMLVAPPTKAFPFSDLGVEYVYLVLHGKVDNGTAVFNHANATVLDATTLANGPASSARVADTVFSNSCWGALAAVDSAYYSIDSDPEVARTPDDSLALMFLILGARAFVGFTASSYIPTDTETQPVVSGHYLSAPLQQAFWESRIGGGLSPASALFEARKRYIRQAPYPADDELKPFNPDADPLARALEMKTFWSATCLGLGW